MLYLFKLYHRQLSASSFLSRERKATRKRTYGVLSPRGIVSVLCFRCEVEVFSSEFRHLTKHQVFNSSSKLLLSTYPIAFSALSLFSLSNFLKFCTFCLCNFKEKDLLKKWSKTRTFWLIQLRRNMPFLQTDGWDPSTSYWKTQVIYCIGVSRLLLHGARSQNFFAILHFHGEVSRCDWGFAI